MQPLRGVHPLLVWWCGARACCKIPLTRFCAAQGILRDHVLPRLEAMGAPALWLHLAEQAAAFERALAPLRGLPAAAAGAGDADADAPELWAPGSCLETVCANPVRRPPQSPLV